MITPRIQVKWFGMRQGWMHKALRKLFEKIIRDDKQPKRLYDTATTTTKMISRDTLFFPGAGVNVPRSYNRSWVL